MFPGHHLGPHKWLAVVEGVIDTAQGYLEQASKGTTKERASILVRDAERLGNTAYRLLRYMSGSEAEHIPHQIVAPFQRSVDALGIKNTIFFRADHVPNYELRPEDLRKFVDQINDPSQSLLDAVAHIEWPILRVTVPSQAMGMLPHFSVVAHELGHAIQHRIKFGFRQYATQILDAAKRVEARLAAAQIKYGKEEQLLFVSMLASWTEELKSDAVGYYLFGPAFYFALSGFLELVNQGYGIGEAHPPSHFRRCLLVQHLVSGAPSFSTVLKEGAGLDLEEEINSPHLSALPAKNILFGRLSLKLSTRAAAVAVELVDVIELMGSDIYDSALKLLQTDSPDLIYTPVQLKQDLKAHLEPLINLVPPIEARQGDAVVPSSLASILNVGWAALLAKITEIQPPAGGEGDADARQMERLHELLLKAVELSEARRLWDEQP